MAKTPATPEDKKTIALQKKEEAAEKARQKQEDEDRKKLLDTMSNGFKSLLKGASSIEKLVDNQLDYSKKTAESTKKMSSSFEKFFESAGKKLHHTSVYSKMAALRIGTLIDLQREMNADKTYSLNDKQFQAFDKYFESSGKKLERTADYSEMAAKRIGTLLDVTRDGISDNTVTIYQKQFELFEKYFESSGKKLERTADYSNLTAQRTWTMLSVQREIAANKEVVIAEKQWDVFKKMRERLVKIQSYTDFTSARVWVLQDLTKENTKAVVSSGKESTKYLKNIVDSLDDIFNLMYSTDSKKKMESGSAPNVPSFLGMNQPIAGQQNQKQSVEFKIESNQYSGLINAIKNSSNEELMMRMFGASSGNSLGHLHHIRKLLQNNGQSFVKVSAMSMRQQQRENAQDRKDTKRENESLERWQKDADRHTKNLFDSFTDIFQRGIIGRLAGLNPLIGMAVDVIQDVGQTVGSVAETIKNIHLIFAHMGKKPTIGSGTESVTNMEKAFGISGLVGLADFFADIGGVVANLRAGNVMGGIFDMFSGVSSLGKFAKAMGKRFVFIQGTIDFFSNVFTDIGKLENKSWTNVILTMAGEAAISLGSAVMDMVVDLPTLVLGKVFKWLGAEDFGNWLMNTDFSNAVGNLARDFMTTMINSFSGGLTSGMEFLSVALEAAIKNVGVGLLRLVGANETADTLQSSIGDWTSAWAQPAVGVQPAPVIPADITKNAQQSMETEKQASNVAIVAPTTTVVQQPKPDPVPYAWTPAFNPRFADYG